MELPALALQPLEAATAADEYFEAQVDQHGYCTVIHLSI